MVLDPQKRLVDRLNQQRAEWLCQRQEQNLWRYDGVADGGYRVKNQHGSTASAGRLIGGGAPAIGDPVLRVSEAGITATLGRKTLDQRDRRRGRIYAPSVLWFGDNYDGEVLLAEGDFNLSYNTFPRTTFDVDTSGGFLPPLPAQIFEAAYSTIRTLSEGATIDVSATITPFEPFENVYGNVQLKVWQWIGSGAAPNYQTMADYRAAIYAQRSEVDPTTPRAIYDKSDWFNDVDNSLFNLGWSAGSTGTSVFSDLSANPGDGGLGDGIPVSGSLQETIVFPGIYMITIYVSRRDTGTQATGEAGIEIGNGKYDVSVTIA